MTPPLRRSVINDQPSAVSPLQPPSAGPEGHAFGGQGQAPGSPPTAPRRGSPGIFEDHRYVTAVTSPEDYAECRRVMRGASKNYSFASRFLPTDKRRHVEALYALMRVGDDRVDVSHAGFASPLEAIEDWEQIYWQAFESGSSLDPVIRAYLNTAIECDIPAGIMASYFRAMKDDLTITRFPTFNDLMYYMEGSALTVGRAMTYILGVRAPYTIEDTLPYADSLSIAMQLTNFWRDVGQDWRIGRVYIPQEDLRRFNVTEAEIADGRITTGFVNLMEFEIERTDRYYQHARAGVRRLASGRWGVMSGLEIYRTILKDIQRNGYNVFTRRSGATRWQKVALVVKAPLRIYWSGDPLKRMSHRQA